jgi:hypothetical protein
MTLMELIQFEIKYYVGFFFSTYMRFRKKLQF